jgi:hypothetical protein
MTLRERETTDHPAPESLETQLTTTRQAVYDELVAIAEEQAQAALDQYKQIDKPTKVWKKKKTRRVQNDISTTQDVLARLASLRDFTYTAGENGAWKIVGRDAVITNDTPHTELVAKDNKPPETYIKIDVQPLLAAIHREADKRIGLTTPSKTPLKLERPRAPQPAAR